MPGEPFDQPGRATVQRQAAKPVRMKEKVETPEKIARTNRQRLAAEEGAKTMAQIERDGVAIRKNMERLRAAARAARGQRGA